MKSVSRIVLTIGVLLFLCSPAAQGFVHSFQSSMTTSGENPYGSLIVDGSTLYGMTRPGGANDEGTIFSISTSGSSFTLLHSCSAATSDCRQPRGSLVLGGSTLYGMTERGGANDEGGIFSIGTDGSSFTLLHSFSTDTTNGENPYGDLTLDGSTLYGMTSLGGTNDLGTIFSIGTNGSNFTILRSFSSASTDGSSPRGSLVLSGSTLFGMTYYGGTYNEGTVFSIGTSGTGFTLLHSFRSFTTNGENPYDSLILSGSTLYGMTLFAGANGDGAVFSIDTDGTDFTLLHSFSSLTSNGKGPRGNLAINGSTLYGMTTQGGANGLGTLFSLGTDGSSYTLIHSFAGATADGSSPEGSLLYSGSTLYGMTLNGGTEDEGIIFSNTPTAIELTSFTATGRQIPATILLQWETAAEIDTAGFHIHRAEHVDGDYLRITEAMVPAEGGATWGAEYAWEDHDLEPGRTYYYKLEDVEFTGEAGLHGPVPAWAGLVDIKVNGQDGPVLLSRGQNVCVSVEMNPGPYEGRPADHWILVKTPFAAPRVWYSLDQKFGWLASLNFFSQMPLESISPPMDVLKKSLPPGNYRFICGADREDGVARGPWLGLDSVWVEVQ